MVPWRADARERLWKRLERDVEGVQHVGLIFDHDAVNVADEADGYLAAGEFRIFLFDEGADRFRGCERFGRRHFSVPLLFGCPQHETGETGGKAGRSPFGGNAQHGFLERAGR
jgi:hypothetical protein